jgi:murein DD-endopeptidase MepM/ murein hydrolase activator NlpD
MTIFGRHPVNDPVISQFFGAKNTWENPPWHKAIDYAAPYGTLIYAPCDLFIVHASAEPMPPGNPWEQVPGSTAAGSCIIGQVPAPHTAVMTSFCHLQDIRVAAGDFAPEGSVIGAVGSSGNSTGPHLHWEVFIDYAEGAYPAGTFYGRVNPLDYFRTVTTVPLGTGGRGDASLGAPTRELLLPDVPDLYLP